MVINANNFNVSAIHDKHIVIIILLTTIAICCSGCTATPLIGGSVNHNRLMDGVYEGSYKGGPNKALVKVTIKDNTIVHIQIVKHWALKGKKAELPILKRIIERQSTKVDAVSGATNSSRVIMNAVQRAIEKAYEN